MNGFTVAAKSLDSARALYNALWEFHPELTGTEEYGFEVRISLRSGDGEVVAVLDALERHVRERDDGPARVELAGHRYTMHGDSSADDARRAAREERSKRTHERAEQTHELAADLHRAAANVQDEHAHHCRQDGDEQRALRAERLADAERGLADEEKLKAQLQRDAAGRLR